MGLLRIDPAEIGKSWTAFEERLAGNWPRGWSNQVHIILAGCGLSVLVGLITQDLFSISTLAEIQPTLLVVLVSVAGGILTLCVARILQVPRPENVVNYRASPLFFFMFIIGLIILFPSFMASKASKMDSLWPFLCPYLFFTLTVLKFRLVLSQS